VGKPVVEVIQSGLVSYMYWYIVAPATAFQAMTTEVGAAKTVPSAGETGTGTAAAVLGDNVSV
jgi:hypothetical protein